MRVLALERHSAQKYEKEIVEQLFHIHLYGNLLLLCYREGVSGWGKGIEINVHCAY